MRPTPEAYRRELTRADERPLMYLVMLFQFACMLLIAFRDGAVESFSLSMSVLLPLGTAIGMKILARAVYADRCIYLLTAFLCSLGIVLLRAVFGPETNAYEQAFFVGIGYVCMFVSARFAVRFRLKPGLVKAAMPLMLAFLLLPFLFGTSANARNWVRIGSIQFQPSELMKPALIVTLATAFSDMTGWRAWWPYVLFSVLMCGILFLQPDLGSVFLFFFITIGMFYVGTGRWKTTLFVLGISALGVYVFLQVLDDITAFQYLASRIAIWENPWNGEYENARQIVQGLISIASGGWFGAGLGLGSSDRVAVVASDYIFAALSEEFGIPFAIIVLGVYLMILWRGACVAMNARSRYHALIAFGCVFSLTGQMLLIVCGNLHILPLTGVTMPFVSAGGSSMVSSMIMIGLILGVSGLNARDEYDDLMRISHGKWEDGE